VNKIAFKLTINGSDKTALFADRLESITVVDNTGLDSDTVEIRLDDRDKVIALPSIDVEMQVWLGEQKNDNPKLELAGVYTIDEVETDDREGTLTIHGKAADMIGSLKAPRNESYDDITMTELLTIIAQRHDYEPVISESLANKHYEHIDQRAQSDIDLLTYKASELNAVVKPTGKCLCFLLEDEAKTASGIDLPVLPLDADAEGTYINTRISGRSEYGSVLAYWQGADDSRKRSVSVGGREPVYTMGEVFMSNDQAVDAIKSKYAQLQRGGIEMNCERDLDLSYAAERALNLFNHRQKGRYIIKTATHQVGDKYATTSLVFTLPAK